MDTISLERRKYKTDWQRKKRQEQLNDPEQKAILLEQYKEQSKKARKKRTPEQVVQQRLRNQEWLNKNREKVNERAREKSKERYKKIKLDTITAYGGKCECCGELKIEFLVIDHKEGDGNKERKELGIGAGGPFYLWLKRQGFPKGRYRVLCHNCNASYGTYGYCPHNNITLVVESVI